MSLLGTRDDEWPAWINVLDDLTELGFSLVLAGLGIFALFTGNTLGRVVGAGLLLVALAQGARLHRRRFASS